MKTERPFNGVAAVLSLVIPGAGQVYNGKIAAGIAWLIAVLFLYLFAADALGLVAYTAGSRFLLLLPGLALHVACIFNASR